MSPARFILVSVLIGLVFLLGCVDDPTEVGLGLVDVQAGQPITLSVEATAFEVSDEIDVTGGYLGVNSNFQTVPLGAERFLSGKVDDPAIGLIDAVGNMDFVPANAVGDDFRQGPVSTASLILFLDYVYGDTLSPLTVSLRQISDEWSSTGTRADTIITSGPEITTVTVDPSAEAVTISLPEAWVGANDAFLRDESLSSQFHGFQLVPIEGNTVIGFNRRTSLFQISVPGDTLRMSVEKLVTSISRSPVPSPAEYILLQDGIDVASVTLDFARDDLLDSSVHNAIFRLNVGTPELATPANFHRPSVSTLQLIAVIGNEGGRVSLGTGELDSQGRFSISNSDLTLAMQNTALGIGDLVRFELAVPVSQNSLDYVFLKRTAVGERPRMLITVTEVN